MNLEALMTKMILEIRHYIALGDPYRWHRAMIVREHINKRFPSNGEFPLVVEDVHTACNDEFYGPSES